jgi:hypothetical protein
MHASMGGIIPISTKRINTGFLSLASIFLLVTTLQNTLYLLYAFSLIPWLIAPILHVSIKSVAIVSETPRSASLI